MKSVSNEQMESTLSHETQIDALQRRCAELESELEYLRLKHQTRLTIATDVHRSLLPGPVRHDRIWIDVRYVPIEEVGGDYCQVRFPDRATCYVTMCDVMGHGVGSALLATRISSEVRYGIIYGREPHDIVRSLERFVDENFSRAGLFLSFVAARIDLERMELTWSGAGHPSPLLIRPEEHEIQYLTSQNPVIGIGLPASDKLHQDTIALNSGDRLFFFTDGLFEVHNVEERQLGITGFAEFAKSSMSCDLFEVADNVLRKVHEYQFGPNTDDQTLVVAEMR
jgi:serine phosphatase RsbU (regulator of sigma subunit)